MIPAPVQYAKKPCSKKLDVLSRELAAGTKLTEDQMMARVTKAIQDAHDEHIFARKADVARLVATAPGGADWVGAKLLGSMQLRLLNEMAFAKEYVLFNAAGSQIFEFAPRLSSMFLHSSVTEVPARQVKLPYDAFFLAAKEPFDVPDLYTEKATTVPCSGVYCRVEGNSLLLMPTSLPDPTFDTRDIRPAWLYDTNPILQSRLRLHLDIEGTLEEATDQALETYERFIREGMSHLQAKALIPQPRDGMESQMNAIAQGIVHSQDQVSAAARDSGALRTAAAVVVSWVANALCYVTAYRDTAVSQWSEGTPAEQLEAISRMKSLAKVTKAEKELLWGGYRRVALFDLPQSDTDDASGPTHASPDTHWRRGHWRLQAHGEARSLRRLTWVRPCIVNRDKGVIAHGHVYQAGFESPS